MLQKFQWSTCHVQARDAALCMGIAVCILKNDVVSYTSVLLTDSFAYSRRLYSTRVFDQAY